MFNSFTYLRWQHLFKNTTKIICHSFILSLIFYIHKENFSSDIWNCDLDPQMTLICLPHFGSESDY